MCTVRNFACAWEGKGRKGEKKGEGEGSGECGGEKDNVTDLDVCDVHVKRCNPVRVGVHMENRNVLGVLRRNLCQA